MFNLEKRITVLEGARANVNLNGMSDEELDTHIRNLDEGTPAWYAAVIGRVMRHRSTVTIVVDDPDYSLAG